MSILGDIAKVAGGFLMGGPAGALTAASSLLLKPAAAGPGTTAPVAPRQPFGSTGLLYRNFQNLANSRVVSAPLTAMADPNQYGLINISRPQLPAPPLLSPGPGAVGPGMNGSGGTDWTPGGGGTPCAKGYHYNKTGYYTKRYGWIPAGTVCVKNRKRNPLNPRALSRSISRISSAKSAAKFLSRVSVRESGCGCK